ncbi:MAG: hypothetical protein IPQ14_09150, partial [Candidatus Microthrix sp.]|uniref:hypothetical protein n=1 Tax=Candidatus Neomicrothrix sp. TaxID=2719034 RepID=UPI0025BACB17
MNSPPSAKVDGERKMEICPILLGHLEPGATGGFDVAHPGVKWTWNVMAICARKSVMAGRPSTTDTPADSAVQRDVIDTDIDGTTIICTTNASRVA